MQMKVNWVGLTEDLMGLEDIEFKTDAPKSEKKVLDKNKEIDFLL